MVRPFFYNKTAIIDEILRVDHAGEYGAIRIYKGQLAGFESMGHHMDVKPIIEEMLEGEQKHLKYFEQEILRLNSRPTLLLPIWHVAGYVMGFLSSVAGVKYAMLCTEAVEEVIDQHYQKQHMLLLNMEETGIAGKIEDHRLDELEHKKTAIEYGSLDAEFYHYVKLLIGKLCKFAIFTSKII